MTDTHHTVRVNPSSLSKILDISEDAILAVGEDQIISLFNQGAERIFGYTEEEAVGEPLSLLLPPGIKATHQHLMEKFALSDEISIPMSSRIAVFGRRRGGEIFPAKIAIAKVDSDEGALLFTAIVRDVTDQKQREMALEANRQKFEDLVETSHDLISRTDRQGYFTYLNPAWRDVLGYRSEDMVGHHFSEFKDPDYDDPAVKALESIHATGAVSSYETTYLSLSGEKVILSFNTKPIYNTQGDLIGTQGSAQDVTLHRQVEAQLQQSHKLEALGTLAGGIAHDFNNILGPILEYADLISGDNTASEEHRSYAGAIYKNSERARKLVSQILLFSSRGQATKKNIDACTAVTEAIEFARSTLPNSIILKERFLREPACIRGDPTQIHQVLINLFINAEHAITDIGAIDVSVNILELRGFACVDTLLTGNFVRIAVTDNGRGMSPETIAQIFDPFFTTRRVGEGSGLGLSTVFGIVREHGGGIAVKSDPDKGTTFEVFLPHEEAEEEQPTSTVAEVSESGDESILFVDDEEEICEICKLLLERLGYKLTLASNGEKALEIFTANPDQFQLVVTDQIMPHMTGDQLAKALLEIRPDLPIMICTGHSSAITEESASAMGVRKVLQKPIQLTSLAKTIRELLD